MSIILTEDRPEFKVTRDLPEVGAEIAKARAALHALTEIALKSGDYEKEAAIFRAVAHFTTSWANSSRFLARFAEAEAAKDPNRAPLCRHCGAPA